MRDLKALGSSNTGIEREDRTRGLAYFFIFFIVLMLLLLLFTPKESFSGEERKELQKAPDLTARDLFDGSYEEDMEEYISDHFPFRSFWVGLNSYADLCTGRTLINTVYVGKDGYILREPVVPEEDLLDLNMAAVLELGERTGAPVRVLAVPETGFVMENKLPSVHLPYEDGQMADRMQEVLGENIQWIECCDVLAEAAGTEQVYYRTDHHWTTQGAWKAYLAYCTQTGLTPLDESLVTVTEHGGFLGTTYAKVLLWGVEPDTIELWQYPVSCRVTTLDPEKGGEPVTTRSFYDMGALGTYDPYMVFFGGNHGWMQIVNEETDSDRSLLVVKDSYANCFLPFLAHNYREITVVDPRYYGSMTQLVQEESFDEVLILYGIGNLASDPDLGLIWI